jgi:ferredoxin-NADP reductase
VTGSLETVGASSWREAVIERVAHQTPRVASIFLRAALERHEAGQHVDLRLSAPDGYQAQRSYSIASAPGDQIIELAVERLEDGEVSTFLHDVALPGDTIEVRGPIGGHFIWTEEDGGPVLLIAGGSGVAPLMSIVRRWSTTTPRVPLLLAYSTRAWDEIIFRDELLRLEAREPLFRLVFATTREPRHRPTDLDARFGSDALREIVAAWHAPKITYICGATAFVEAVAMALVENGIPPADIRTERYGDTSPRSAG